MTPRDWFLGSAAAVLVLVSAAVAADEYDQTVRGKVAAVDTSSGARGDFRLDVRVHDGKKVEKLDFRGSRLGALPDLQGHRPVYHVVLIDSGATKTADFGAVHLSNGGSASLHFDSRRGGFPSGVTTLTSFGGGKLELQRDGAAVLRGDVPVFVGLRDQQVPGSTAMFHGKSRLGPTPGGGAARGLIDADASNGPNRSVQRLRIAVRYMGTIANPFTVVAIDGALTETTLGTITTRGAYGSGELKFDTRHGASIPTGSLAGLSGMTIEVRNSSGVAILSGNFPPVP
jgi:hypothetical protein